MVIWKTAISLMASSSIQIDLSTAKVPTIFLHTIASAGHRHRKKDVRARLIPNWLTERGEYHEFRSSCPNRAVVF